MRLLEAQWKQNGVKTNKRVQCETVESDRGTKEGEEFTETSLWNDR